MLSGLLDADIIIGLLRKYPPALAWAATLSVNLGIPSIVWLEVIDGAKNKAGQQIAISLMKRFYIIPIEATDNTWVMKHFPVYFLSHNVGIHDCFIAAISVRLNLPIYTRNVKHYKSLPGVQIIVPY